MAGTGWEQSDDAQAGGPAWGAPRPPQAPSDQPFGQAPAAPAYGEASGGPAYGGSAPGGPAYGGAAPGGPAYGGSAPGGPAYGAPASGGPAYGGVPTSGPAYGAAASGGPAYGAPTSGGPAYGGGQGYGGAPSGGPAYGGGQGYGSYGTTQAPSYGSGYAPVGYGAETIVSGPTGPKRGKRRGATIAGVVAAAVAVAGVSVGGYFVYSAVGGGGDQPEQHLPAATVAMAKLDLDPSLGQKVDAIRFARKFPGGKDYREDGDPREYAWKELTKNVEGAPSWDKVSQWIGNRAAAAVMPDPADAKKALPFLAISVTDEKQALADMGGIKDSGVAAGDGWLYVTSTDAQARLVLAAAQKAPLSGSTTFGADMDRLGEDGIAAFWVDAGAASKLSADAAGAAGAVGVPLTGLATPDVRGHGAFALRFDGTDLELAGTFTGSNQTSQLSGAGTGVEALPVGSLAAVGMAGLGEAVTKNWDAALKQITTATGQDAQAFVDETATGLGISLPEDLGTLLGSQFAVSVGGPGPGGIPWLGARVTTDGGKAEPRGGRLADVFQQAGAPVTARTFDGGYAVATPSKFTTLLTKPGDLGAQPAFQKAVPDASKAAMVAYANVPGLVKAYGASMTPEDKADVAPIEAVGMSVVVAPNGDSTFRLKVTTR